MARPEDLYRAVLLDHARSPRHAGRLASPAHHGEAHNALCGDRATVTLTLATDGRLAAVACDALGCAIHVAAGSLLATAVIGATPAEARALCATLRAAARGDAPADALGDLAALATVAAFPARRRCATLAADALEVALEAALDALT